jgi:hypothetical protein
VYVAKLVGIFTAAECFLKNNNEKIAADGFF